MMGSIGKVARVFAALALVGSSGCAMGATGDEAEASLDESRAPLLFDQPSICPDCVKELLCDPLRSDDCCDPTKYDRCSLQSDGPDADVKVKLYQCLTTSRPLGWAGGSGTTCEVEPGWTVISGGAQVLDASSDDVVITISQPDAGNAFPEDDMRGARVWEVGTVSRRAPTKHRIRAYALGIKLKGYDNVTHFAPLRITLSGWTREELAHPRVSVKVRDTDILLGGGYSAQTFPFNGVSVAPVLAYAEGTLGGTWHAAASNLRDGNLGDIRAKAVSIARCPSRWQSCFAGSKITSAFSSTGTGVRTAFAEQAGGGYLLTGVGAWSSDWNRPLASVEVLSPELWVNGGVRVSTSGTPSGRAYAQALHLRR